MLFDNLHIACIVVFIKKHLLILQFLNDNTELQKY